MTAIPDVPIVVLNEIAARRMAGGVMWVVVSKGFIALPDPDNELVAIFRREDGRACHWDGRKYTDVGHVYDPMYSKHAFTFADVNATEK